jgi:hypothetical protein
MQPYRRRARDQDAGERDVVEFNPLRLPPPSKAEQPSKAGCTAKDVFPSQKERLAAKITGLSEQLLEEMMHPDSKSNATIERLEPMFRHWDQAEYGTEYDYHYAWMKARESIKKFNQERRKARARATINQPGIAQEKTVTKEEEGKEDFHFTPAGDSNNEDDEFFNDPAAHMKRARHDRLEVEKLLASTASMLGHTQGLWMLR